MLNYKTKGETDLMKIEKLSECSVKIILTGKDLSDYGIRYDSWDSQSAAGFLLSVSDEIKEKTGADITSEKLYVEIFSRINSCLIFVSFPPKSTRRIRKEQIVCTFPDFESLKSFCRKIYDEFPEMIYSDSLYYSPCTLRLIFEIPSEYLRFVENSAGEGTVSEYDAVTRASTHEYYVCAESYNAVEKIVNL